MRRREVIQFVVHGSLITFVFGCKPGDEDVEIDDDTDDALPDATVPVAADAAVDACVGPSVKLHDTYAQALYFDGTKGPLTGTITVAQIIASVTAMFDFWHGHGGMLHRYTLTPANFAALKSGQRVTVMTSVIDGHQHELFIDPRDEAYRVPNAPDVDVPLGC